MSAAAIRNYAIAQAESPEEVIREVTAAIKEGFQPLGGIAVVREPAAPNRGKLVGRTLYVQSLVRLYQPGEQLVVNGAHG